MTVVELVAALNPTDQATMVRQFEALRAACGSPECASLVQNLVLSGATWSLGQTAPRPDGGTTVRVDSVQGYSLESIWFELDPSGRIGRTGEVFRSDPADFPMPRPAWYVPVRNGTDHPDAPFLTAYSAGDREVVAQATTTVFTGQPILFVYAVNGQVVDTDHSARHAYLFLQGTVAADPATPLSANPTLAKLAAKACAGRDRGVLPRYDDGCTTRASGSVGPIGAVCVELDTSRDCTLLIRVEEEWTPSYDGTLEWRSGDLTVGDLFY